MVHIGVLVNRNISHVRTADLNALMLHQTISSFATVLKLYVILSTKVGVGFIHRLSLM
jgi:hypothetical protein